MSDVKPANVQKRDTTFKQEHGAVAHLMKRKPEQAVARAVKGATKLLDEGQGKQALNVLTLTKPLVAGASERAGEDAAAYYTMLAKIHRAMGEQQAAERAEAMIRAQ